jgi:hypothetical protein
MHSSIHPCIIDVIWSCSWHRRYTTRLERYKLRILAHTRARARACTHIMCICSRVISECTMVVSISYSTQQLNLCLEVHSVCKFVTNKMCRYDYNIPMSNITCLGAWHFSGFRKSAQLCYCSMFRRERYLWDTILINLLRIVQRMSFILKTQVFGMLRRVKW